MRRVVGCWLGFLVLTSLPTPASADGGTGGLGMDFLTSGVTFDNTGVTTGGQGGRGGNSSVGASGAAGAGGDALVGTGTLTVTNSDTIIGGAGDSGGNGFTNTGASSMTRPGTRSSTSCSGSAGATNTPTSRGR